MGEGLVTWYVWSHHEDNLGNKIIERQERSTKSWKHTNNRQDSSHCKLVFLPPDNGRVQMIDEGVRIAEIQEEDFRTFGDRPIPFDGTVNTGIDQDYEAKGKDMPSTSLPLSLGPNQLSKQLLMNPPVLAESAYSKD